MNVEQIEQIVSEITMLSRMLMNKVSTNKTLNDKEIIKCRHLLNNWKSGIDAKENECYLYKDNVYRVRKGKSHKTQNGWEPDIMADSWESLDIEHTGTIEDPIIAKPNMEYFNEKYYIQENVIYLCTRDTQTPISQMPKDLIGVYFEVVS